MKTFINPAETLWDELCLRPSGENAAVRERVEKIILRVKADGDKAIRELSEEIDRRSLGELLVSRTEMEQAAAAVSEEVKAAITEAAHNISKFHQAELPSEIRVETSPGVVCIQRPVPIQRIGLYVPGGTAPLFSTVLMLALPAKIAGCPEIVLCTPCGPDGKVAPAVLYAASVCGVEKIFKVGGAQAIAAMAYGTESIPKTDKIFGPGNQYVTTAKQILGNRQVSIDMPAGPSEVMVMADRTAVPSFVAADLLSQAEHGADSQVMLVCDNEDFASEVLRELAVQQEVLSRKDFINSSLEKSRCVVFDSRETMTAFANRYASEHLVIAMENPWEIAGKITSAGSVFIGNWSCESAGDYASGTNHTLPTCGWARSFSGVNIDSYMRKMTIQELSKDGLEKLGKTIVTMAEAEGLQAHANAVRTRLKR